MARALLQKLAGVLMVPIVLLPVAAVLQAAGFILGYEPLAAGGRAILVHFLPLFFAIAAGVGFGGGDAMAALAAVTCYVVTWGVGSAVARDPALNPGALGGLLAGAAGVWLYGRFHRTRLPEFLALFSGKRLVPTLAALAGVPLGILLGLGWPWVLEGIRALSQWVFRAGPAGAFVYGAMDRVLVPTGLHHLLNNIVEYQLGTYADPVTGRVVTGEIQRFYARDPSAGLLMSGFYVFNNFSVPAAALAIAHAARPEARKRVSGLMWTGLLTSVLTGVTEPVEFAFIFASPVLWGAHVLLTGLASCMTYALGIRHWGYALPMYVINWPYASRAELIPVVGIPFAVLYYALFRAYIARFRPPVLGQESDPAPGQVPQPEPGQEPEPGPEPQSGPAEGGEVAPVAAQVLRALGGPANLKDLGACMSRLRVEVRDPARVDGDALRAAGAHAVVQSGAAVQVVLGPRAEAVRAAVASLIRAEAAREEAPAAGPPARDPNPGRAPGPREVLLAPLTGHVVPLSAVPDPVFAAGHVGQGVAVAPTEGVLVAPAGGTVAHVAPGGHAVVVVTGAGLEVLLHVGIDTVRLGGTCFRPRVRAGDRVRAGEVLVEFDLAAIEAAGCAPVSPVVITNPDRVAGAVPLTAGPVRAGETPLLQVTLR